MIVVVLVVRTKTEAGLAFVSTSLGESVRFLLPFTEFSFLQTEFSSSPRTEYTAVLLDARSLPIHISDPQP
jgi:hypothetical protein